MTPSVVPSLAASIDPTCEVMVDGGWTLVTAAEAHAKHRSDRKRCPACHGQVMTTSTYTGSAKVFLVHHRAHYGCPLDAKRFTGTASPHPKAVT